MNNHSNSPTFIWIAGLPGSGNLALRSLLDGHPDIVAFPFELSPACRFYNSGHYRLRRKPWKKAARMMLTFALRDQTFADQRLKGRVPLDLKKLSEDVLNYAPGNAAYFFEIDHFFDALFHAYRHQFRPYERAPRYFGAVIDSPDLPWEEVGLMERSRVIVPSRGWSVVYDSHRNWHMARTNASLAQYFRKKAIRYTGLLARAWDWGGVAESVGMHEPRSNFYLFDFEKLREGAETEMAKMAAWLDVPYRDLLTHLTVMGISESGVMTGGGKTNGKISSAPSRYYSPTSAFEMAFHAQGRGRPLTFGSAWGLARRSAREVLKSDLSGEFAFRLDERAVPDRVSFYTECRRKNWNLEEGREKLKAAIRMPGPIEKILRWNLFWTFMVVYVGYRLCPRPKYYGYSLNLAMRLRLFFPVLRSVDRLKGGSYDLGRVPAG